MFNNMVNGFDSRMIRNRSMRSNVENASSYWPDDEIIDGFNQEVYPFVRINTRTVWITNYITDENFPINVPADDPLVHIASIASSAIEVDSVLPHEIGDSSLLNQLHTLDLTKLNLDDLLLLLHRLQQQTIQNSVVTSTSTMSSLSSSSSSSGFIEHKPSLVISSQLPTLHSFSPTLSNTVHSSLSMLEEIPSCSPSISRRQSSFTLANIADAPKQLTTTLAQPISSLHSQNTKHIHSPDDVVNKLLQSFNMPDNRNYQKITKHKPHQHAPSYTYQESQQHKAKFLSNLFSSNSIGAFPHMMPSNNASR